jgi:hypothetical protein
LVERFIDLIKHLSGHRILLGQGLPHTNRLTALSGKCKCYMHALAPPLIVITAIMTCADTSGQATVKSGGAFLPLLNPQKPFKT